MANPRIAVVLGSKSDLKHLKASKMWQVFEDCGIPWRLAALSAHRHDVELTKFCEQMIVEGVQVFIGTAGMTPALPGAIAAKTKGVIPVIGVPLSADTPDSFMGIYGITGLPPRTVAAAFGFNSTGLINAAIFAVQILAGTDPKVTEKLVAYLEAEAKKKAPDDNIPLTELEEEVKKA